VYVRAVGEDDEEEEDEVEEVEDEIDRRAAAAAIDGDDGGDDCGLSLPRIPTLKPLSHARRREEENSDIVSASLARSALAPSATRPLRAAIELKLFESAEKNEGENQNSKKKKLETSPSTSTEKKLFRARSFSSYPLILLLLTPRHEFLDDHVPAMSAIGAITKIQERRRWRWRRRRQAELMCKRMSTSSSTSTFALAAVALACLFCAVRGKLWIVLVVLVV